MKADNGVNIYKLAEATGFSISTVSKAINNTGRISEKTRKLILDKAAEMNYVGSYHAKALSLKKSWNIGVIFSDNLWVGFSHPFFSVVLEHFKRRVEDEGYEVMFINRNMAKSEMTYLEFCQYHKLEGVFMVNSYSESKQIPELVNSGIPVVTADAGNQDIVTITSDDFNGARLAASYLSGLGHKRIYSIAGPQYTTSGRKRLDGFIEELDSQGLQSYKTFEAINYGYDDGYNAALDIIKTNDLPTAIFAAGDWLALGAIKAFKDHNIKVPEDISVIGFDDLDFVKYVTPALTTVAQMKEEIGFECAYALMDMIDGKEVRSRLMEVKIIERESCKKI